MTTVGSIESLWRYPVKSMSGEQRNKIFLGFAGVYGDRCYAFRNSAARKGAPYLTASTQQHMLRYRPQFRYPERAGEPPNLAEAMSIEPGITYANGDSSDLIVDVITPSGTIVPIDDPRLVQMLQEGIGAQNLLTLVRSDRALTDCRPVSLISMQTVMHLEAELNIPLDKRRFRANIYMNLSAGSGFGEDGFVGCKLRIGSQAVVAVLERDPRCSVMSLDPDTGEHNPDILRKVVKSHDNLAGVYCAVLVEGSIADGDSIKLLD
ncbi:MAG: MOSC domain-containing protein [Bacteroidota bacterium]